MSDTVRSRRRRVGRARTLGAGGQRHRLLLLAVLLGALSACWGSSPDRLSGDTLVEALRDGGYVLLLRHAQTSEGGVDALDTLGDCAAQRALTDAGRQDARELGTAVQQLGVRVGRVVTSPFCRTVETAELAFGAAEQDDALLALASVGEDGGAARQQTLDAARALASQPPEPGTITVLVGHVSTIEPLTGVSPDEGGTVVLRPDGDGAFDVVGQVTPGGFPELATGQ